MKFNSKLRKVFLIEEPLAEVGKKPGEKGNNNQVRRGGKRKKGFHQGFILVVTKLKLYIDQAEREILDHVTAKSRVALL